MAWASSHTSRASARIGRMSAGGMPRLPNSRGTSARTTAPRRSPRCGCLRQEQKDFPAGGLPCQAAAHRTARNRRCPTRCREGSSSRALRRRIARHQRPGQQPQDRGACAQPEDDQDRQHDHRAAAGQNRLTCTNAGLRRMLCRSGRAKCPSFRRVLVAGRLADGSFAS